MRCCVEPVIRCSFFFPAATLILRTPCIANRLLLALSTLPCATSLVRAMQDAPKHRMIRMLEIGAGTGGTTSFLFPHLPSDRTHYVFTDVSPLFLTRARDEFRDHSFVSFELLDIERPPVAQGFSERSFDVIIAANALHATRDLRETLGPYSQPPRSRRVADSAGRNRSTALGRFDVRAYRGLVAICRYRVAA